MSKSQCVFAMNIILVEPAVNEKYRNILEPVSCKNDLRFFTMGQEAISLRVDL